MGGFTSNKGEGMKCQECEREEGWDNPDLWCPEFDKHLCDDCYTEFRGWLRDMFSLSSFEEACELLDHINIIKWKKERANDVG